MTLKIRNVTHLMQHYFVTHLNPIMYIEAPFRDIFILRIQFFVTILYQVQCALFYIENDAEIFPAHYTWKAAEKGLKMAFNMNKLSMINSCEIILET